jgi:predicted DsbA family dithiol-disulfide isomerase
VREEFDEARARGIRGVPSVVIGGDWLMTGARPLADYRETVARYCQKRGGAAERFLH